MAPPFSSAGSWNTWAAPTRPGGSFHASKSDWSGGRSASSPATITTRSKVPCLASASRSAALATVRPTSTPPGWVHVPGTARAASVRMVGE